MKQYKIIQAYNAVEKFSELPLTEKEQWEIYKLRKILRPHNDFQEEREEDIKKKYLEFADENGHLSEEKAQEYIQDLNEVGNLDIELQDFQKPVIRVVQGLTFKVIEELEDFIEFIPPD